MRGTRLWLFGLILLIPLLPGCSRELQVTVLYDYVGELRPGDRVSWEGKTIGTIQSVEVTAEGRYSVHVSVGQDFRQIVTDQSRFHIQADPLQRGRKSVVLVILKEGGKPLPNDATVEGSPSFSLLLEQSRRELEVWFKRFHEEIETWKKELFQAPVQEWHEELDHQIDYWADTLERSGKEMRRYFTEEVLPFLDEAVEDLKRHLQKQGREKDIEPLEEKLKNLKRT
jgi:hypothetical protein